MSITLIGGKGSDFKYIEMAVVCNNEVCAGIEGTIYEFVIVEVGCD